MTNKLASSILCFTLLCGPLTSLVLADPIDKTSFRPAWHAGIYGGAGIPKSFSDIQGKSNLTGLSVTDLKLQTGPMFGMKLGVFGPANERMGRWFGAELDVSYLRSELKAQDATVSLLNVTAITQIDKSKIDLITGAIHFLIKYPGTVIQPYVGAGPAIIHAKLDKVTIGGVVSNSSSATSLGLSGVGGVRVKFTDQIGGFLEYKHIRAGLEFETLKGDAVVHAAVAGVNFTF
jgi:opacity protein-like surface antigen